VSAWPIRMLLSRSSQVLVGRAPPGRARPAAPVLRSSGRANARSRVLTCSQTQERTTSTETADAPAAGPLASTDVFFDAIKHASSSLELAGVARFLGVSIVCVLGAYSLHPTLLQAVADFWDLKPGSDASFENSFFSLVGIIYGLLSGNTFLFLYERQVNIVQELYGEAFALELLLQQTFLAVDDPEVRAIMSKSCRRYIREEMYMPTEMSSPFTPDSAFVEIVGHVVEEQTLGLDVEGLKEAAQKLADAQSRRSAVAAQVLPGMHWVFLHTLEAIFLLCFLVFDATTGDELANGVTQMVAVPERQLGFAALTGVLVLTSQVLHDLDSPVAGLYSFRRSLDLRLQYVIALLDQLEGSARGFIPPELVTLQRLGLVGAFSSSAEMPSTAKPRRKGRTGRADQASYAGGPLHMWESAHGRE